MRCSEDIEEIAALCDNDSTITRSASSSDILPSSNACYSGVCVDVSLMRNRIRT
jgi:hypothetical protein